MRRRRSQEITTEQQHLLVVDHGVLCVDEINNRCPWIPRRGVVCTYLVKTFDNAGRYGRRENKVTAPLSFFNVRVGGRECVRKDRCKYITACTMRECDGEKER
jgi:hypothetical protein